MLDGCSIGRQLGQVRRQPGLSVRPNPWQDVGVMFARYYMETRFVLEEQSRLMPWSVDTNLTIQVNKNEFPMLFAIAMDYLLIQASSVPCEHVFSSAKETDTSKRNRMNLMLMEALQTLKFSLKKDWQSISFTEGWQTSKAEMMRQKATKGDLLKKLLVDRQPTTDILLKFWDDEHDLDGEN